MQKLQKNNLEKHICHQFGVTVSSVYPVSDNSSDPDKAPNFEGSDLVRFEPEDRIQLKNVYINNVYTQSLSLYGDFKAKPHHHVCRCSFEVKHLSVDFMTSCVGI